MLVTIIIIAVIILGAMLVAVLESRSLKEKAYREHSIAAILASGFPREQAHLLDRWIIDIVTERTGDDAERVTYLPRPLWDREALMTRPTFARRADALAHIADHNGELLE